MGRRGGLLVVAALLLGLVGALPAGATDGRDHAEVADVVGISDGDTFRVDYPRTAKRENQRIRMMGLQAMEVGACGGRVAESALARKADERRVRLLAEDPDSTGHADRPIRRVEVPRADGTRLDVNRWMLRRGHGLWFPNNTETRKLASYHKTARRAFADGRGIWDPQRCGKGPRQGVGLELRVQWDADGNDNKNLNGEFVRITNTHPRNPISLSGWTIRDSSLFDGVHRIPKGKRIAAGRTLTVHVGDGPDRRYRRYLDAPAPLFENTDSNPGDGAYLFDKDGDLRAHMTYPCAHVKAVAELRCGHPRLRKLEIAGVLWDPDGNEAEHPNREKIVIRNTADRSLPLEDVVLSASQASYEFHPRARIGPGGRLTVRIGKGDDTATTKYWGFDRAKLPNAGGRAELRTYDDVRLDCVAWGSGTC